MQGEIERIADFFILLFITIQNYCREVVMKISGRVRRNIGFVDRTHRFHSSPQGFSVKHFLADQAHYWSQTWKVHWREHMLDLLRSKQEKQQSCWECFQGMSYNIVLNYERHGCLGVYIGVGSMLKWKNASYNFVTINIISYARLVIQFPFLI